MPPLSTDHADVLHTGNHLFTGQVALPPQCIDNNALKANAGLEAAKLEHVILVTHRQSRQPSLDRVRSRWFDLDVGAGVTTDEILLHTTQDLVPVAVRLLYADGPAGTVSAGNIRIGTTMGGQDLVSTTAYNDAVTSGTVSPLAPLLSVIPAHTTIWVRHTGVAAGQAGQVMVELEYLTHGYSQSDEVYPQEVPLVAMMAAKGRVLRLDATVSIAGTGARTVTIDLQRSRAGSAPSSILLSPCVIDATLPARVPKTALLAASQTDLAAGDCLYLVLSVGGMTGSLPRGLVVNVRLIEQGV